MPRPDSENREDREEDSATSTSDDQVCQNYGQTVYMVAGVRMVVIRHPVLSLGALMQLLRKEKESTESQRFLTY